MEVRWLGTSNQGQKEGSNITVAWELRVIATMYMNSGYLWILYDKATDFYTEK